LHIPRVANRCGSGVIAVKSLTGHRGKTAPPSGVYQAGWYFEASENRCELMTQGRRDPLRPADGNLAEVVGPIFPPVHK